MAKSSKTNKRKKAQTVQSVDAAKSPMNRRDMLRLGRNGALGLAVLGGAGFWVMNSVQAMASEQDLTRVGQGKPSVVQIHDPSCPTCTALQRETRKAMKQFGECDVVFLVADISQDQGRKFAVQHGVGHVTLLLFDADGNRTQTLQGMRHRAELETILAGHFKEHGAV
jgi:NAD(P)H-hydrate repair Nnr-like enzyme with NAD(P)H-hydrate dehydratase domain